jgi:hypothetical protein
MMSTVLKLERVSSAIVISLFPAFSSLLVSLFALSVLKDRYGCAEAGFPVLR